MKKEAKPQKPRGDGARVLPPTDSAARLISETSFPLLFFLRPFGNSPVSNCTCIDTPKTSVLAALVHQQLDAGVVIVSPSARTPSNAPCAAAANAL